MDNYGNEIGQKMRVSRKVKKKTRKNQFKEKARTKKTKQVNNACVLFLFSC